MSENLSEEEYLRRHLEDLESHKNKPTENKHTIIENNSNINVKLNDLNYFNLDAKTLPCGIFYPIGSLIQVRPALVKEIQAYSMVDDNNFYDIVEKMNDMLASCVRIKYTDGRIGTYLEIKDPDRYYLIFVIRELTFQNGSSLMTTVECSCKTVTNLELKRENFRFFPINDKLSKYFSREERCFLFETKDGGIFRLAPPTIGIQKAFSEYIIKENAEKRKLNLSFLKIIPFMLHDRSSITNEGIQAKLTDYEKMDDISFQFLNSAVEKITFGIKELVKLCPNCGLEVHSDMLFPNGPSAIFLIHDAFDQFIKE